MTATGETTLMLDSRRREADAGLDTEVGALVETYGTLLYRVAYSVVRSRPEAEDVVQDAFVRVLEHRKALPAVREMRVWLVRITWNLALDRRRRVRPDQMDAAFVERLAATTVAADEAMEESRSLALLLEGIERLPRLERQVLLLSAVEELSTSEVAKIVERSESATRALLFRARVRLKERLRGSLKKGGRR